MSTQADLGAAALSNRDYPTAILHYTTALRTSRSPLWLTNRSIAYTRIGNHEAALRDANEAVLVSRVRARRELILQAQMRRAISLFSLGRLGDAKAVLELIKDKVGEKVDASWGVWMMKVGKALEGCAEEERKEKEKVTVGEWPEEVEVEEEVEEVAGKGKEVEKKGEKNGGEEKEGKEKKEAAPAVPAPKQVIRHEWYQSSDSLSISILCKGVDKEKVEVTFEEEMVSQSFSAWKPYSN
jgi:suppressor of G2 allele of SKP1